MTLAMFIVQYRETNVRYRITIGNVRKLELLLFFQSRRNLRQSRLSPTAFVNLNYAIPISHYPTCLHNLSIFQSSNWYHYVVIPFSISLVSFCISSIIQYMIYLCHSLLYFPMICQYQSKFCHSQIILFYSFNTVSFKNSLYSFNILYHSIIHMPIQYPKFAVLFQTSTCITQN